MEEVKEAAIEFNFRADREMHLRMLCEEMGRTVGDFVNEAVLTFMEDYEDGRDTEVVMQRVRSGEEQTFSLEEVMKDYAMEVGDHPNGTKANEKARPVSEEEDRSLSARESPHAA